MIDTSSDVALIGIGEMGGVFARAFLNAGLSVHPVTRSQRVAEVAARLPEPELALVAVGEADLHTVLDALPLAWARRVGLIQNELLPRTWQAHDIEDPTVAVVWFEKKPGTDVKVIVPTPVGGPQAPLVAGALNGIGAAASVVDDAEELLFEMVLKNLYILTANIAGLETGGTVGSLWENHNEFARAVAGEVLTIQEWLTGGPVDRARLVDQLARVILADPEHGATGRSAPTRLARALDHARRAGVQVPNLERIARDAGMSA